MIARRALMPSDYEQVKIWAHARGLNMLDADCFPVLGRIVDGYAAGWIYRTDSRLGYIDNLISNPDADAAETDRAIDCVAKALMCDAQEYGVKQLQAMTFIPGISARAKALGWSVGEKSYKLMAKGLG